jgi:hypothetical protein
MLVKFKPVSGGSYALLFDESAGDACEKFLPAFVDNIMAVAGYGAASGTTVPMNNTRCTLPLRWSSNYASADAAAASIATLRAAFKGVPVHLQVTVGATVLYFPNAVLATSNHEPHGRECQHQMTFQTADVTTTAP